MNIKIMMSSCLLIALFFLSCKKGAGTDSKPLPVIPPPSTVLNTPGPSAVIQSGDFTIAVLPDTQYYVAQPQLGGTLDMFKSQITWIQNNQVKENIAYVAHMGDITEHGDNPATSSNEWNSARIALYGLENSVSIPYGLAVGNHDQYPSQYALTGTTNGYNLYFGPKHFEGRSYYGGHYSNNNDCHFDLFSAGGVDFIVIYLEYDIYNEDQAGMNTWADGVLATYSSRKAIIVSHSIMSNNLSVGTNAKPGNFSAQGLAIYNSLKFRPNVFMMLNGHHGDNGEGYRQDTYGGNTIRTFLSDYQSRANGGGSLMRLYKISVKDKTISVRTIAPYYNQSESDGDSEFITPLF